MMTTGTLDFAPGKLLIALQMLLALRAREFELIHKSFGWCAAIMRKPTSLGNPRSRASSQLNLNPYNLEWVTPKTTA